MPALVRQQAPVRKRRRHGFARLFFWLDFALISNYSCLIDNGMELKQFQEYDYSPYNCFNKTFEFEPKKYRIKHLENKIPMVYSIVAKKKN